MRTVHAPIEATTLKGSRSMVPIRACARTQSWRAGQVAGPAPSASRGRLSCVDLSPAMIRRARRRHRRAAGRRFVAGNDIPRVAAYTVASGVMNVMLDHPCALAEKSVAGTLHRLHASSRRGFAANFMAEKSDGPSTQGLHRTDPPRWTSFCRVVRSKLSAAMACGSSHSWSDTIRDFCPKS